MIGYSPRPEESTVTGTSLTTVPANDRPDQSRKLKEEGFVNGRNLSRADKASRKSGIQPLRLPQLSAAYGACTGVRPPNPVRWNLDEYAEFSHPHPSPRRPRRRLGHTPGDGRRPPARSSPGAPN